MKPCICCGERKGLDEYYVHPRMADGHLNKCKACCKEYARHSHMAKVGDSRRLEQERQRGRDKYRRLYAPTLPFRFTGPDAPHEVKARARGRVWYALQTGAMERPTRCEDCGAQHAHLHGHHEDYDKPLAVVWLCPACHRHRHLTRSAA